MTNVPIVCGGCGYITDTIENMNNHTKLCHGAEDVDPDYWENTINRVEQS